jgi:hypothetical protein
VSWGSRFQSKMSSFTIEKGWPESFYSLGLMPTLIGLGHLVPAVGAIHTATGIYQFPWPLLGMISTSATLVDCKSEKQIGIHFHNSDDMPQLTIRIKIFHVRIGHENGYGGFGYTLCV